MQLLWFSACIFPVRVSRPGILWKEKGTMGKILLEAIVTSLQDARAAAEGGADRFELCSALALGGLTPSLGTLACIKAEFSIPVMCMIRPREAGMAYSEEEYRVMEWDARKALEAGADGLVFGFLTPEGEVDLPCCRAFLELIHRHSGSQPRQAVFHRAFDLVRDPRRALEQLIEIGFNRVLTSGGRATAREGVEGIRQVRQQARGRLEVLPGGGVNEADVAEVVRRTGCNQVHVYLPAPVQDPSVCANAEVYFGTAPDGSSAEYPVVSEQRVRQIRYILDSLVGGS